MICQAISTARRHRQRVAGAWDGSWDTVWMPQCNAGALPTAQDLPCSARTLCIVLPSAIFWCQNFLLCCHGGGLAHPPVDLGCYVSQEDACTTSSPLLLIPGPSVGVSGSSPVPTSWMGPVAATPSSAHLLRGCGTVPGGEGMAHARVPHG